LLSHQRETNSKIIGLTATKSEQKVYETNRDVIEGKDTSKLRSNFIYHIEKINGKSMVICQLFNQLKPDEFYDWINQLWSEIEFMTTLCICSQNKANYFGESMQTFPCVKYISSIKSNLTPSSYLEEPNFIGGLPAARNIFLIHYHISFHLCKFILKTSLIFKVMHLCLLKKIPFSAFVCYSTSISIDLPSVKRLLESVATILKDKNFFIVIQIFLRI
jgi:hypothetical protein